MSMRLRSRSRIKAGRDNSFLLDRKTASKMLQMNESTNERTPLLLSEDCSYSQLPLLIHSSKYIVRKLTVDGKEFDVMGPNDKFEG